MGGRVPIAESNSYLIICSFKELQVVKKQLENVGISSRWGNGSSGLTITKKQEVNNMKEIITKIAKANGLTVEDSEY